ncbi:MAG: ATP-dependent DNA helicase [Clostridia bacterium]
MKVQETKDNLDKYLNMIKDKFPNYEKRPEQYEMIRTILNGIYLKKHILVEAGTGTGKSLAYILATLAIMSASDTKQKTIISTYTINLQKQLLEKDFPQLQFILGLDLKVALAKGRRNYICQNRLINILNDLQGVFESAEEALNFRDLLEEVYDGKRVVIADKADIKTRVAAGVWDEVCSTHETCLDEACPYISDCLFKKDRRELDKADFIISNHALFLTDLLLRGSTEDEEGGILPEYDFLIFDEAHHLENSATSAFSIEINKSIVNKPIIWLRSMLNRVMIRESFEEAGYSLNEMNTLVQSYFSQSEKLGSSLEMFLEDNLTRKLHTNSQLENFLEETILELVKALEIAKEVEVADQIAKIELNKVKLSLESILEEINFVLSADNQGFTYWVERSFEATAYAAPLEVDQILEEKIFSKNKPVIATSATLAVPQMDFFANRLGIKDFTARVITSSFDHKTQAKLILPDYAIEPRYNQNTDYEKILVKIIKEARSKISGGMFVLFTSYKMLDEVYSLIKDEYDEIFVQGTMPRSIILEEFANHGNAILLGTSSFWEGVDVVGDGLRCVLITKLPFPVPKDPLIEARMDRIKESGGNSFRDYMLPQAILQFKQGFGRLIRSKNDTGVVIVADKRIVTKGYGKMFLKALPNISIKTKIEDV